MVKTKCRNSVKTKRTKMLGCYNGICFYCRALEEVVSEPIFDFKLDPVLGAAVLVAIAGLFGVIAGVILVKRGINRKRLLLLSGLGTAIAFLILGIYFHYDSTGKYKIGKTTWLIFSNNGCIVSNMKTLF